MMGNNLLDSTSTDRDNKPARRVRGSRGAYPYDEGQHLIVAADIWVYGDESGMEAAPQWCVVSAYIGNPRTWAALKRDWAAALRNKHLVEFHAKIFFKRGEKKDSKSNPYASWTDAEARDFIACLAGIIRKYRPRVLPLEAAINVEAFRALPYGERRFLTSGRLWWTGGDYRTAFKSSGKASEPYMVVFQAVAKAALRHGSAITKVHFAFDQGKHQELPAVLLPEIAKLRLWKEWSRIGDIVFPESESEAGIQMADLRGYLINRFLNVGAGMKPDEQYAFAAITKNNTGITIFTKAALEESLSASATPQMRAWLRNQPELR